MLKGISNKIVNLVRPGCLLTVPCTYVQASNDYLVNKNAVDVFNQLCLNIKARIQIRSASSNEVEIGVS